MKFISQHFSEEEYSIEFNEIISIENTSSPNKTTVQICVRKSNSLQSIYQRTFEKKLTPHYYKNFTKKFLENNIYRQQFLAKDSQEWHGIIYYTEHISHVHAPCKFLIEDLNTNKNVKFRDLVKLKSFGRDIFSTMSLEELKNYVNEESYQGVTSAFEESQDCLIALRWIARGLLPTLSIYKVKVDKEVEENKKKALNNKV